MLKFELEIATKIAQLIDDYHDKSKIRILAIIDGALGYRLLKIDQPDLQPESKPE